MGGGGGGGVRGTRRMVVAHGLIGKICVQC